jgi:Ca2+-binding EF-hand superfamily protein
MGSCVPSRGLSPEAKALAVQIFNEMDTDGNKCIDVNETLKFWHQNFAKINTKAMFEAVDMDKNQKIDLKEWIHFWTRVKKSGHSEEDILEELQNLKNRGSWVQFVGVRSLNPQKID